VTRAAAGAGNPGAVIGAKAVMAVCWGLAVLCGAAAAQAETWTSQCMGTTSDGSLAGGLQLPLEGPSFRPYCLPCVDAGRTHGHQPVIESVVAAYFQMAESHPGTMFVYGEIGFPHVGHFLRIARIRTACPWISWFRSSADGRFPPAPSIGMATVWPLITTVGAMPAGSISP